VIRYQKCNRRKVSGHALLGGTCATRNADRLNISFGVNVARADYCCHGSFIRRSDLCEWCKNGHCVVGMRVRAGCSLCFAFAARLVSTANRVRRHSSFSRIDRIGIIVGKLLLNAVKRYRGRCMPGSLMLPHNVRSGWVVSSTSQRSKVSINYRISKEQKGGSYEI
jgi:hypothetical protein